MAYQTPGGAIKSLRDLPDDPDNAHERRQVPAQVGEAARARTHTRNQVEVGRGSCANTEYITRYEGYEEPPEGHNGQPPEVDTGGPQINR